MTKAKERPIIMGAHSISAILTGKKTQTRRVVRPQPDPNMRYDGLSEDDLTVHYWERLDEQGGFTEDYDGFHCPYGVVADRLWVRETYFVVTGPTDGSPPSLDNSLVHFKADADPDLVHVANESKLWQTPLFMPRWASRLTLELTDIRVERLQDITEADAVAEGESGLPRLDSFSAEAALELLKRDDTDITESYLRYVGAYALTWNNLNKERGFPWKSNPWVWVISFKRVGP